MTDEQRARLNRALKCIGRTHGLRVLTMAETADGVSLNLQFLQQRPPSRRATEPKQPIYLRS